MIQHQILVTHYKKMFGESWGDFTKRILGVTVNKKTVRSLILTGTEAFRQIISSYFNKTSGG